MYGYPGYGGQMPGGYPPAVGAMPGGYATTTTYVRLPGMVTMNPYMAVPTFYNRVRYNWMGPWQDPRIPFMPPMGLPPHITALFMEASCVFRHYDRDFSGTLELHEFQNAMYHLGYRVDPYQIQQMFMMIDTDRNRRLSEREFCEFWVFTQQSHTPGFGMWF